MRKLANDAVARIFNHLQAVIEDSELEDDLFEGNFFNSYMYYVISNPIAFDAFAGDINKNVLTHNILIKCFIRGKSNGFSSKFMNLVREKKFVGDGGNIITKDGKKYATRKILENPIKVFGQDKESFMICKKCSYQQDFKALDDWDKERPRAWILALAMSTSQHKS